MYIRPEGMRWAMKVASSGMIRRSSSGEGGSGDPRGFQQRWRSSGREWISLKMVMGRRRATIIGTVIEVEDTGGGVGNDLLGVGGLWGS